MAPYSTGRRTSGSDHGERRVHAKASDTRSGFEFVGGLSDLGTGAGMLIFMLAPFSLPVLALTALAAVALPPRWSARCSLRRPCWRGGGGDHVIACPAIPSPPGGATVKRECHGVGASERSAARLSQRFEAQER